LNRLAAGTTSTNKFFLFDSGPQAGELFFSADGTAAHAIDVAKMSTGVTATDIHVV